MDLYQTNLCRKRLMRGCSRFGHGFDPIGFTDKEFKVGITHPCKSIFSPLRSPAVHEQKSATIFFIIITHDTLGMTAETYHASILIRGFPKVFAHHGLHIAATHLHADDNRRALRDIFLDSMQIDDVIPVSGSEPVKTPHL